MNKLLYRPKEAAQMLGIGRDKLYDLMRSGRLHSVKDGVTATALAEYVAMLEGRGAQGSVISLGGPSSDRASCPSRRHP